MRGCPSPAYLFVCRSVRGRSVVRASGPRGQAGAPGRALPAHLQPPLPPAPAPGKRDRGAAARVFLAGLVAAPRATALLGETARGSRGRSPRRCRCLLGRFLQVPSQSAPLARWLPGRLGASAGGRAGAGGGAAEGGEPAGGRRGVLFGDGAGAERVRREDRPTPKAAPGTGRPGRASCLLPPSLRELRGGSDSRGREPRAREQLGALGAWRGGWGDAMESIFWRKADVIGSRVLNQGA